MKQSTDRILTTHTGSLPRPAELQELLHAHLFQHFLLACQKGDLAALTELLAKDSIAWADGGGKAKAMLRPVFGQEAVVRLLLGVTRKLPPGLSASFEEANSAQRLRLIH